MSDRLYTTNQLAKLFGVVPTTVIDWIEAGKLEAFKTLGGHRRITHLAVLEFLRRHGLPSPPAFAELTRKLVVLDDEPDILSMFGRMLRKGLPGTETILVDHPVEALMRIGAERPQVVVFDIYMPDMDGFEFCRRLRENLTGELCLLAISGDSSTETRRRVLEAGADRFLAKTEANELLVKTCEELLEQQPARA
ncbi:MAG: response regulator [Acidobacteriota bacterium]